MHKTNNRNRVFTSNRQHQQRRIAELKNEVIPKIKTCPHCGGEAMLKRNYNKEMHYYFMFVKCRVCGAQGKITGSDEDFTTEVYLNNLQAAIDAWNTRVLEKEN